MKRISYFGLLRFLLVVCLSAGIAFSQEKAAQLENRADNLNYQWNRASLENSAELFIQAAEEWKRIGNAEKTAACFRRTGEIKILLGEKEAAVNFFQKALAILANNNFPAEKTRVLSDLSQAKSALGKPDDSEKYYKAALAFSEKNADASARAAALQTAGEFFYIDDLAKSLSFYEQSVKLWEQSGDARGEAFAKLRLGYIYSDSYNYEASLKTLNSSLAIWEKLGDLRGQAITLKAFGTVYNLSSEKQKALEYYQKAETLLPKDIDYFEQASLYNSFGSIYEFYGMYELSIKLREKALKSFQIDNHHYGQLATLTSLARLNSLSENNAATLAYIKQAEELSAELKENLYAGLVIKDLGNFYFNRGEMSAAETHYRKAMRIFSAKGEKRQFSIVYSKLGTIYAERGDFAAARRYFVKSLELNKQVRDNFAEAEILYQFAELAKLENNSDEALALAQKAVAVTESLSSDVLNAELKRTYFSSVYARYELYINLLSVAHKRSPEKNFDVLALQASEKSRARSLLETLGLAETGFTKDADPEIVRREKEIRNLLSLKANQLSDLYNEKAAQKEIDKVTGELNNLSHQLEDVIAVLKQNSPLYAEVKNPPPFDVKAFQDSILDEQTVLLEFSFGAKESYLWLVGKNDLSAYILPNRGQIETQITKLRELLAANEPLKDESIADYQTRTKQAEADYNREAKILSDALFGQIAEQISGKRLIIVPDGKLQYFPVSALPFPNSDGDKPFLLTNEIVYEPSASTLLLSATSEKSADNTKKILLVFADPVFTREDARLHAGAEQTQENSSSIAALNLFRSAESLNSLPRLFASKDEADSIIKIVGDDRAQIASGFAATRERFLDSDSSSYKIIHFATHNYLDETRPELSSLVLSRFAENGESRDGVVRLNDIYGLNLTADLVVLSACSTGIGKEIKGEGLMSLDNAFLQVGAKSVISSLWKAEDNATRDLMSNFYGEMATGTATTTAEALRLAQIKTRENPQYRSPFYWAAFTIKGNFRAVPQISRNSHSWIYAAGAIPFFLLMLGGSFHFYRRRKRLLNREIVVKS